MIKTRITYTAAALATLTAFAAALLPACASGGGSGGASGGQTPCTEDSKCKGARICEKGACVEPPSGAGGAAGGGGTSAGGSGGGCQSTGDSCEVNDDCCDYRQGNGYCVNDGNGTRTCHDMCSSGSDCLSGCCVGLDNGDSVCASADKCGPSCVSNGDFCGPGKDCCSVLEGHGDCVNEGNGTATCHDTCFSNADCVSGCCVPLSNGDSVCAAASHCGG